jgi:uncharacterized protein (TIGR02246 family)
VPAPTEPLTGAAEEVRQVVLERIDAVRAKDPEPLATRPSPDVVAYNVLPPLAFTGSDAQTATTQAWFDGYETDIGYEVRDLQVVAEGDIGVCWFLYHVSGTLVTGGVVDMWVRATLGLRRIDGRWRIVHDHESVPFDPATGRALIDLDPDQPDR